MKISDVQISTVDNLLRFYRTVRHLKLSQVYYRIYYVGRKRWRMATGFTPPLPSYKEPIDLDVQFPVYGGTSYLGENTFKFLNQSKTFSSGINWNFIEYGTLWNYNLLYFDFIQQPEIKVKTKIAIIHDFLDQFDTIHFAKDPYPISLRCINWIKFLVNSNIRDQRIIHSIYKQYYLLMDCVEYHLLGNHLFENACSLLIGGIYFDDAKLLDKARVILFAQLEEQILEDGGHFERSPMYHQLLLYRLLDCCNMLSVQVGTEQMLKKSIKSTIERMLGWLKNVTFINGNIPLVNDATEGVSPETHQLIDYARQLGFNIPDTPLHDSGYRMIRNGSYELFIDVGDIGPDYIPGHAHSDTFSFILNMDEKPIIVDTGISTYKEGARREAERSTIAHNTVMVNEKEQTEVWKSFRVGRRAHVTKRQEGKNYIVAEHDGYINMGITHRRRFNWNKNELYLKDEIKGNAEVNSVAYLHFHPDITVENKEQSLIAANILITFSGCKKIEINPYCYAAGYNKLEQAHVAEITFEDSLETLIKL